ncbi:MAG: hypothetical protein HRU70_00520 [Phycisphaeraceae bacterium]|nr:MAG: hypothetical protein HRU70_00520 [Phycisphaeraceae bacterium]
MWRIRTIDDRGRPCRLVRLAPLGSARGRDDPAPFPRRAILGLGVIAAGATGLGFLAASEGAIVVGLCILSPVLSTMMFNVIGTGVRLAEAANARGAWLKCRMIRVGRCPSCAYPIAGLAPEPDGCVVCPECAAAWSADGRYDREPRTVVVPAEP